MERSKNELSSRRRSWDLFSRRYLGKASFKEIGVIASLIILMVTGTLYASDYRTILSLYPDKDLFLLVGMEDRVELLGRSKHNPEVEFFRWQYRDDYTKVYFGSDLVSTNRIYVFEGSTMLKYREVRPIRAEWNDERAWVVQQMSLYEDSYHTRYKGELIIETEIYPDENKITIKWYPADDKRYNIRMYFDTDVKYNKSIDLDEEYPEGVFINPKGFRIDWSDSLDKLSQARQYKNGRAIVIFKSAVGNQVIDPEIGTFRKRDYLTHVETRVDLTWAYSHYRICNPTNVDYRISRRNFGFNFAGMTEYLTDAKIQIRVPYRVEIPKYEYVKKCEMITIESNKTESGFETIEVCREEKKFVGYEEEVRWRWEDFDPENKVFRRKGCYDIRIYARLKPKLGFRAVENVPFAFGYVYNEFAWWNSSWNYKMPVDISVSSGTTVQNFQMPIILNSSNVGPNFNWTVECVDGNSTRLRVTNSSENAELDIFVENCSVTDENMTLWVEVDQNISTSNYTIYIYYGNNNSDPISEKYEVFGDNIVSFWRFEGNAVDIISGNDGTLNGNAAYTSDGWYGQGLSLDGDGDYISVPDDNSLDLTEFTIAAWGKRIESGEYYTVLGKENAGVESGDADNYRMGISDTDKLRLFFENSGHSNFAYATSTDVNQDEWAFLAVTFSDSGDTYQLIINNTLESGSSTATPDTNAYPVWIGATRGNDGSSIYSSWNGTLDEVRLYNASLTQDEINRFYFPQKPVYAIGAEETPNSAPNVSLISPSDNYLTNDDTPTFTFKYVDDSDASMTCELFLNDTGYGTVTANNDTNTDITANSSLSGGAYNWYVNCTDSGSLTGQSEIRSITIDLTAPQVTIYSPENTTYTSSTVNFNWSFSDNIDTEPYWAGYSLNGAANVTTFMNETSDYSNTNSKAYRYFGSSGCWDTLAGEYTSDMYTNMSSSDDIYANASLHLQSDNYGSSVFSINVSRPPSQIGNLSIYWEGNTSADITVMDWADLYIYNMTGGNWIRLSRWTIEDTEMKEFHTWNDSANISNFVDSNGMVNLSVCIYDDATNLRRLIVYTDYIKVETKGVSSLTAPEGSNNLTLYANDTAGNLNSSTVYFTVDLGPPNTTASAIMDDGSSYAFGEWNKTTYVNITLTCSDAGVGCDTTLYCIDSNNKCTPDQVYSSPFQVTNQGVSFVRYHSNDTLGNWESVKSSVVKIDGYAPKWDQNSSFHPAAYEPVESYFTINVWDNETMVDEVIIEINWSGSPQNYSMLGRIWNDFYEDAYSCAGDWDEENGHGCDEARWPDSDWGRSNRSDGAYGIIYQNWSRTIFGYNWIRNISGIVISNGALWPYEHKGVPPLECWIQEPFQMKTVTYHNETPSDFQEIEYYCWNSTDWYLMYESNSTNLTEEEVRAQYPRLTHANYSVYLPAGTYYWKVYVKDALGNWNESDIWTFTIEKATPSLDLYFDGQTGNQSYELYSTINITADSNVSDQVIKLSINASQLGTNFTSGTSPLEFIWDSYASVFTFNDSTESKTLTSNQSVYFDFGNESVILLEPLILNTSGSFYGEDYPIEVRFDIGNDSTVEKTITGELANNSGKVYSFSSYSGWMSRITQDYEGVTQDTSNYAAYTTYNPDTVDSELSDAQYDNISDSDDTYATSAVTLGVAHYTCTRFDINLSRDRNLVRNLTIYWEGNTTADSSYEHGQFWVYNHTSGSWVQLESWSDNNVELVKSHSWTDTSALNDLIGDDNLVQFRTCSYVSGSSATAIVHTDYAKVETYGLCNTSETVSAGNGGNSSILYIRIPRNATVLEAKVNVTGVLFDEEEENLYTNITLNTPCIWPSVCYTDEGIKMCPIWAGECVEDILWVSSAVTTTPGVNITQFEIYVQAGEDDKYYTINAYVCENEPNCNSTGNLATACTFYDTNNYTWTDAGVFVGRMFEGSYVPTSDYVYFMVGVNDTDGSIYLEMAVDGGYYPRIMTKSYPQSFKIDIGNDGDWDYSRSTELSSTITVDLDTDEINDWIRNECTSDVCEVPIKVVIGSTGALKFDFSDVEYVEYDPDPVILNKTAMEEALPVIEIGITADAWGKLNLSDIEFNYSGTACYEVTATIDGDENYTSVTQTSYLTLYHSNFTVEMPYDWTDEIMWFPATNSSKGVWPWGQTLTTPIYNITAKGYDKPFILKARVNSTLDPCLTLKLANNSAMDNYITLNTTWQTIPMPEMNWKDTAGIWLEADLDNCSSRWIETYVELKACCVGCREDACYA